MDGLLPPRSSGRKADQRIGSLLVLDDRGSDGVEKIYEEARRRQVGEIMTTRAYTVTENASLREILDLMLRRDIKHVPVLREEEPVGMVARHDLLKLIYDRLAE